MLQRTFTAAIHREGDLYVALCPELDVASQGETIEAARESGHEENRIVSPDICPRTPRPRKSRRSGEYHG